ncbi:unnamed protein product [Mytilus edulis]|uniref:Uncharacterized protein n=1 Tax=Mytilus edulis TaxID=6550 RepID=A0A8S3Q9L6_MYTED|nr:unnamed protein product [Mytilus edulis]
MENSIEKKFHDEIIKLCDDNKSSNNSIFTRERYTETIGNYSCPELTDTNDGFCNSIFGSVEGPLPITEDTSIYSKDISKVGAIVKLGVLGFSTHSVIYAGTTTGKIGKIFMDDRDSRQIGSFKIVQHSFPVLDIKVNNNEDVYVMTKNCVVNIADKDPCSSKLTCLDCMKSKNPACGWDIPASSCKDCVMTSGFWCVNSGSCVMNNKDCTGGFNFVGIDVSLHIELFKMLFITRWVIKIEKSNLNSQVKVSS